MFSQGNLKKRRFGDIDTYMVPSSPIAPLAPAAPSPGSYVSPGSAYGIYVMAVPLEGDWLLYVDGNEVGMIQFSRPGGTLSGMVIMKGTSKPMMNLSYDQYRGTISFNRQGDPYSVFGWPAPQADDWSGRITGAEFNGSYTAYIEQEETASGEWGTTSTGRIFVVGVGHSWRAAKKLVPAFVSPELVSIPKIPEAQTVVTVPSPTGTPAVVTAIVTPTPAPTSIDEILPSSQVKAQTDVLPSPSSSSDSLKSPAGEAFESILEAGFPTWGWIVIGGIALAMLGGMGGKQKWIKGKERRIK
jgi:hypothetical protein